LTISGDYVGIGEQEPLFNLHVSDSDGNCMIVASDGDNDVITKIQAYNTGQIGIIGTHSNHDLQIRTNNSEAVYIDVDGNVGIGTAGNPTELLHIKTSSEPDYVTKFENGGNTNEKI